MKKSITRIGPVSAAKVMALLYFFISIPFALIMAVVSHFAPPGEDRFGIAMVIIMPILYAAFGFIFTLIGAWLYNVIAAMVGGIEYISEEV